MVHIDPNVRISQRWSSEAPNRGGFEMWFEYSGRDWQQSSSVPRDSTWAWMLPARWPMSNCARREPHFSPSFSHISSPTDLICVIYLNKKYHCNKNGAKRSSTWPDTPFWPISLRENQQKGCQKGGKSTFTKYTFQTLGWFGIIKEVLLSDPPFLFD